MTTVYEDFDPEDEYDASDPAIERLRVIILIIAAARARPETLGRRIRLVARLMSVLETELDG